MFQNIKAGWALGKQVRKLVFSDRRLLLYPVLMAVVVFAEMLLIFGSLVFGPFVGLRSLGAISYMAALFIFYLVSTFTSTYVLVALLIGFRAYASGKPISIGESFSAASQYSKYILEWALFYSIVLMIIRALEQRLGNVGRLVLGLAAGIALSVAAAFVVPVIIDNKLGPISAMKESASFFLKNFGRTLGGLVYSDLYNLMFIASGMILIVLSAAIILPIYSIVAIPLIIIGFAIMVFGVIMNYLTSNVFKLILYDYVRQGTLPSGIDRSLVEKSLAGKKNNNPGNSRATD